VVEGLWPWDRRRRGKPREGLDDAREIVKRDVGHVIEDEFAAPAARARLLRPPRAGGGSAEPRVADGRPPRALLADALTEMARGTRDGDAPAIVDRFQVVVNVDLESLVADAPGSTCRLACGTVLAPETARRLGCDQQVIALHRTDGHYWAVTVLVNNA
jgi:hypothetical protein